MSIAYYNGQIMPYDEIRLPLTDRSIFFGDGIYDAAIGRSGKIYLLSEHLDRFYKNAQRLAIPVQIPKQRLAELLLRLAAESRESCYFVYFQLSRYGIERKHSCCEMGKSNLLITVTGTERPDPDERIRLVSYPDKRYGYCGIKTLNLLPSVLASVYAKNFGAGEAVFIRDGVVTECAHSNISILVGDTLLTHPTDGKILPGIMRAELIGACREMGITVRERPFTREELMRADAALVTSSTKLCRLATELDGEPLCSDRYEIGEKLTKKVHFSFVDMAK